MHAGGRGGGGIERAGCCTPPMSEWSKGLRVGPTTEPSFNPPKKRGKKAVRTADRDGHGHDGGKNHAEQHLNTKQAQVKRRQSGTPSDNIGLQARQSASGPSIVTEQSMARGVCGAAWHAACAGRHGTRRVLGGMARGVCGRHGAGKRSEKRSTIQAQAKNTIGCSTSIACRSGVACGGPELGVTSFRGGGGSRNPAQVVHTPCIRREHTEKHARNSQNQGKPE